MVDTLTKQPILEQAVAISPPKETPAEPIIKPEAQPAIALLSKVDKTQDPDLLIQELTKLPDAQPPQVDADAKPEVGEQSRSAKLKGNEDSYLSRTRDKFKGQLDERYKDPSTEAQFVKKQIETETQKAIDSAKAAGVDYSHEVVAQELKGKAFDQETAAVILAKVQERVTLLFNSEHASMNAEKQRIVAQQTEQYMGLLQAAQAEGSMPNLQADAVLQLVDENIGKLAYQDRVATENWLGDHGVRHLVEHNIGVAMKLSAEMERNGLKLTKAEEAMLQQMMIDHDMGYAMDVVRNPINQGGFGADGGHNVLAAKFVREQLEDPESALTKVFSEEQIAVIHQGILEHDSREVKLTLENPTQEQRNDNLYSIVHAADNTHAFEDKLPEILYGHPDTLRVMRLMKTAGETGDEAAIAALKIQLATSIDARSDISADDKVALKKAGAIISPGSYQRSVPRICGNKPELTIEDSAIHVQVTESAIHQEVMGMFDKDSEQLVKFIGDTAGIKDVDLGTTNSVTSPEGTVVVTLRTGERRATEKTDYQQQIEALISDPTFRNFVIVDGELSMQQKFIEAKLKEAPEGSEDQEKYTLQVQAIKDNRRAQLGALLPQPIQAPINKA